MYLIRGKYPKWLKKYDAPIEMLKELSISLLALLRSINSSTICPQEYVASLENIYKNTNYSPKSICEALMKVEIDEEEVHKSKNFNPVVEICCTSIMLIDACNNKLRVLCSPVDNTHPDINHFIEISNIIQLYSIIAPQFPEDVIDTLSYTAQILNKKFILQGYYDHRCCGAHLSCSKAIIRHWLSLGCLEKWAKDTITNYSTPEWVYSQRYLHESGQVFNTKDDIEKWADGSTTPPRHFEYEDEDDIPSTLPTYSLDKAPFVCLSIAEIKFKVSINFN